MKSQPTKVIHGYHKANKSIIRIYFSISNSNTVIIIYNIWMLQQPNNIAISLFFKNYTFNFDIKPYYFKPFDKKYIISSCSARVSHQANIFKRYFFQDIVKKKLRVTNSTIPFSVFHNFQADMFKYKGFSYKANTFSFSSTCTHMHAKVLILIS